jgi:hypothetical protein
MLLTQYLTIVEVPDNVSQITGRNVPGNGKPLTTLCCQINDEMKPANGLNVYMNYLIEELPKTKCKVENCTNYALDYNIGYCQVCHEKSMRGKRQNPSSNITTENIQPKKKKTKLDQLKEKVDNLVPQNSKNASSIPIVANEQKRHYSIDFYEFYCKLIKVLPWPIDPTNLISFGYWLCLECEYASTSIKIAFVQIKKHQALKLRNPVSESSDKLIERGWKQIDEDHPNINQGAGKAPCIYDDLKLILERIPLSYQMKESLASSCLLAFYTGARVSTITNIKIGDIEYVKMDESGQHISEIQFIYRVLKCKGQYNNHKVTYAHNDQIPESMNLGKWLMGHLKNEFKIDLSIQNIEDLPQQTKNKKIWDINRDTLSLRFSTIAYNAGFPEHFFTFHSLR